MLLKNKFYTGVIVLLFLIALILTTNKNVISSSLGEKLFYIINGLIVLLILIGVTIITSNR